MPKNTKSKTKIKLEKKVEKNSIWDIFKFGESYTSLILGIVVVIIATILLLTFVKNKNNSLRPELANQTLSEQNTPAPSKTQNLLSPEQKITTIAVTRTVTKKEVKPTIVKPTITVKPTQIKPATKPTVTNKNISGATYTVKDGDTLWSIAEKKYKSGYNWVDIQQANKLSNPDTLFAGTKLTLPNVEPKISTVIVENKGNKQASNSVQTTKITGAIYTIVQGDNLWDIAVRAYGDGYAWTKISKANNLSNPDLIHPGNKLSIPRK